MSEPRVVVLTPQEMAALLAAATVILTHHEHNRRREVEDHIDTLRSAVAALRRAYSPQPHPKPAGKGRR